MSWPVVGYGINPVSVASDGGLTNASSGYAVGRRQAIGNNLNFPLYYQSDTNTVRNMLRKHAVAGHGTWRDIRATYCFFTFAANVEAAITAPFTLRSAIEYGGQFWPMTFQGQRDVVAPVGISFATSDIIPGLQINGGFVNERLRTVSNAANDSILVVGEYEPAYGEWVFSGTDTAVDYTLGGEPGKGAMGSLNINGSGTITGIVHSVAGSGYTGSNVNVYAFDPGNPFHTGDLIATRSLSGGAVTLGTQTTGLVQTAGPSSGGVWGPGTYPVYRQAGQTANNRIYGATLITGVSSDGTRSVIMMTDSNGSYGAGPTVPDALMARSIYERCIGQRAGVVTFGCPGWTAAAAANEATTPTCRAVLAQLERPDVIVQLSGNDMASALGTIQANVQLIASQWRGRGCRVAYATSLPRTTGTFTSAGGQTTVAGYGVGETLDQYNAAVRGGYNGMHGDFGFLEAYNAAVDPAAPNKWRSDGGKACTEGTHYNNFGAYLIGPQCVAPKGL